MSGSQQRIYTMLLFAIVFFFDGIEKLMRRKPMSSENRSKPPEPDPETSTCAASAP